MSGKLIRYLGVLIIFSLIHNAVALKKGYYTIVAPRTVLPDSIFHLSFTLNDFHKSCWFNITITGYSEHDKPYTFESIEVQPKTTKLVELHAPHFNATIGKLEIFGYRGIINKESDLIDFNGEQYWAFIQTNKAKYKPGELVLFRVICIDQLKRPAKLKQQMIYLEIYDDQNNLIKSILDDDVKFVKGVFRSEFQLSEFPVLGVWKIKVLVGDRTLAEKSFEVDRYELPKFYVKINTRNVAADEDKIAFEVSASYFYDEPVKGNLSIIITNLNAPYPQEIIPTITRESQIDGKTTIILDLKNELQIRNEIGDFFPFSANSMPTDWFYKFHIEATVIDGLSEEQSWTGSEFKVYTQPYKIELQAPSTFKSNPIISIKVQVIVKDLHDNLIEEPKTPIEIVVGCNGMLYQYDYNDFDLVRIEYKKQIGNDFAVINVTNKNYSECYLYAEHERSKSLTNFMRKSPLDIEILTESPKEGKEIEIKITSLDPIEEFSYEIVSRRDIIQSDHINVPGNETTYILRLNVTFSMVPKITIYVHHIKNMRFRGQLKDVIIERAFSNSIEIETEAETTPGTSIYVNVTTDEGSYVGLMGLDRSALESIKKKDILDGDNINNRLSRVNSLRSYYPISDYGGRYGDIITFSNAFLPTPSSGGGGVGGIPKRIRKHFPESWLYVDFEWTPAGGIHFMDTTPDTITTWAITGFSINSDTGLTFTKNTTNLKVFQEFFISMDLPSSVKEGEIIEVPIYINNYMDQEALTNVSIETDSEDLYILEHPDEDNSKPNQNISKVISVKKREKIIFFMKPLKQGNYNVTVKAISPVANDAIQKTLNVQSEGISYAMSKTILVHLPEESIQEDEIKIDIPDNDVSGSERVEVSVVGDVFRPLIKNLQKLAKVPYGNAEENIRLIVSNAIVLKYLKALNHTDPSLENKIKLNLELGYQNQLSYKYLDGSFGLFERKIKRTGDIWQTVLALWGLIQAKDFAHIDPYVINRGLDYLQSKQQENGCFKSESGLEEDVKFTAFGLIVFLMDEHSRTRYNEVVSKGLSFLYESTDDLEYSPVSVMSTYALLLGKHEKAEDHLKKLTSNSILKKSDKQMLWTKSDTLQSHLEVIAGSLVNLFESKELRPEESILQIVRELIVSKINESSITHLIALQAMISYIERLFLSKTNLEINFKDDQNMSDNFQINSDNFQVLQKFGISQRSRKLNVQSKGHGFAVVDVRYNYNLVPENQSSSFFTVNIKTKTISKHLGALKICINGPMNNIQNKLLTIMEANLQSGLIFTEKDSQEVENLSEDIKSIQFNDSRHKVIVYFELVNKACIELEVRNSYNVLNSKPGWIIVYSANDKDQKSIKSIKFKDL